MDLEIVAAIAGSSVATLLLRALVVLAKARWEERKDRRDEQAEVRAAEKHTWEAHETARKALKEALEAKDTTIAHLKERLEAIERSMKVTTEAGDPKSLARVLFAIAVVRF